MDFADFWSHVAVAGPDDCWSWTKGKHTYGYGIFYVKGRQFTAHRYALTVTAGPAPDDKPHALHSCDTPSCCNPAHLRWGTHAENMEDKRLRGRAVSGRSNLSHCPHGHELSGTNLVIGRKIDKGRTYQTRSCRECNRLYLARRRAAKKASAA